VFVVIIILILMLGSLAASLALLPGVVLLESDLGTPRWSSCWEVVGDARMQCLGPEFWREKLTGSLPYFAITLIASTGALVLSARFRFNGGIAVGVVVFAFAVLVSAAGALRVT
jgi:hypothetical protein